MSSRGKTEFDWGASLKLISVWVQWYLNVQVCADTVVGDAMLRGISGGQKKRVTTAEMVVGPKKTLFLDEISTGLVRDPPPPHTHNKDEWTRGPHTLYSSISSIAIYAGQASATDFM